MLERREGLMSTSESLGNVVVIHPLDPADASAIAQIRSATRAQKGVRWRIDARKQFEALMEAVSPRNDVTFESGRVGDVPGLWAHPASSRPDEAILHPHGGWFNAGSARAYRHLVGHIAARGGARAFVPDYRLAPEHPFPAAVEDVRAAYVGLTERGFSKIAITGDSAGGNLAIELLVHLATNRASGSEALVGGVALSPVTDLAFSGESWSTRAIADPYFTQPQAAELVRSYLDGHDPEDPSVSPLHADLKGLAPIRVHVGNDEVLLDDSVRLVDRAVTVGVDARLDVWQGMVHGYLGGIGRLAASTETLQLIGEFLIDRFATAENER